MNIVQCNLKQPTPNGTRMMTTWLEKRKGVEVGSLISLKDVEGKWEIAHIYDMEHGDNEFNWHRKWTNNI